MRRCFDQIENRRILIRSLVLQSQQQPQNLHTGERVRFCQAEALRAAADRDLNILCDLAHKASPNSELYIVLTIGLVYNRNIDKRDTDHKEELRHEYSRKHSQ